MIKVTETELIDKMYDMIDELDVEDLVMLAEHMFGGTFKFVGSDNYMFIFELTPNDEYMGAFGDDDGEKENE